MHVWVLFILAWAMIFPSCAVGQTTSKVGALEGVGIDEHLGESLPLNLTFRDSRGQAVSVASLFDGKRPVILSLNYSDCPMLCQLQLNGLVDGLKEMKWNVGDEFRVVSLSIDPLETPQRARQTKQRYVRAYGRPLSAAGWSFLTGDKAAIDRLADAVGFRYRYVPERKEYAHAAAIMVCTPSGRVSRYLYGVLYPAQTLRLALVEAGDGQIGSTIDHVLLFCFHYDATSGRYAPVARQLMKLAAAATLVGMLVAFVPAWLRRRLPTRSEAAAEPLRGGSA